MTGGKHNQLASASLPANVSPGSPCGSNQSTEPWFVIQVKVGRSSRVKWSLRRKHRDCEGDTVHRGKHSQAAEGKAIYRPLIIAILELLSADIDDVPIISCIPNYMCENMKFKAANQQFLRLHFIVSTTIQKKLTSELQHIL